MEENFNPVARTRANYYTPGSPVQFVCVELLKGDISGEHAVCLTFKNVGTEPLTGLVVHFKCKVARFDKISPFVNDARFAKGHQMLRFVQ